MEKSGLSWSSHTYSFSFVVIPHYIFQKLHSWSYKRYQSVSSSDWILSEQ